MLAHLKRTDCHWDLIEADSIRVLWTRRFLGGWNVFRPPGDGSHLILARETLRIFGSHFILAREIQWDPPLKMQLCDTYLFWTYLANLHLGIGYHGEPLADTNAQPGHAAVNFSLPERSINLEKN